MRPLNTVQTRALCAIEEIPRLRWPAASELTARIRAQRPVVVLGLYAGQPVSRLRTARAAERALGAMAFPVGSDYYDRLIGPATVAKPAWSDLRTFLRDIRRDPAFPLACTEFETPQDLRTLFEVPAVAARSASEPPGSLMYLGRKGYVAPLHFDGDQRDVLFTPVFGRKRIFLIRPGGSKRLVTYRNFCAFAVHRFPEAEKRRFFGYHEALTCVLGPGETLFIPKLWWHYLENLQPCLAFNVRFGRTPYHRRLSVLPKHYLVQNVSNALIDARTGELREPAAFRRLMRAFFADAPSARIRYDRFHHALRLCYRSLCPDALQGELLGEPYDVDRLRALADADRGAGEYALPSMPRASRIAAVRRRVRALALGAASVRRLLRAFGLRSVGALSDLDARMLLYFLERAAPAELCG